MKVFAFGSRDHVADFGSCSVKDLFVNGEAGRAPLTLSLPPFTLGLRYFEGEPRGGESIWHGASGDRGMFVKELLE